MLLMAGITGVKVDCQAGVGLSGSTIGGGPAAAVEYHAALEQSVAKNFPGNACINCMCHSTENLYRWDASVATVFFQNYRVCRVFYVWKSFQAEHCAELPLHGLNWVDAHCGHVHSC